MTPLEIYREKVKLENERHKQVKKNFQATLKKEQEICPHPEYKETTHNHPTLGGWTLGPMCVRCGKLKEEIELAQDHENIRDE